MQEFMEKPGPVSIILMLCLLIGSVLPACQPAHQSSTPPAIPLPPVTPPAPPPGAPQEQPPASTPPGTTAKWVADGVISADEYGNTRAYGDYSIYWSSDDEYVYIGMKARTAGWLAVGFGAEGFMKNADIIMGSVKDGRLSIMDTFSTGEFGPHPPDTQLGGSDDILDSAGKSDSGYTVVEFKRKLDTGDKYDRPLSKGSNNIIWAYSGEPVLTVKHSLRGAGEIDLK